MFAWLDGILAEKRPTDVVMDVGGVGYEVLIPLSTHDQLPAPGEPIRLLTHFQVREDAQILYGFATTRERRLFRLLLTVNGVGPRIALSALASLSPDALVTALVTGDVKTLGRISGVGKKMAERLAVELRDKFGEEEHAAALTGGALPGRSGGDPRITDAVLALVALGYKQAEADKLISQAAKAAPDASTEDLVRRALGA